MTKEFENEVDKQVDICNEANAKIREMAQRLSHELTLDISTEAILNCIKFWQGRMLQEAETLRAASKEIDRLTEEAYDAWNGKAAD